MQSTDKQRRYIANLIYQNRNDYLYFMHIVDTTPKNNEKYPDERADYTQLILADRLSSMTIDQASYFIEAYNGTRGYHQLKARNILISIIK